MKKDREHLFLDGLLFAGLGYSVAFASVSMTISYYIFPSIILSFPSLAYWTSYFLKNKRKGISILILITSVFLVKDSVIVSYNGTVNILNCRKVEMPVARAIAKAYQNGKDVVWLTSYPLNLYNGYISGIHDKYDKGVEWEFEIYTYFLNYCLNIRDPKNKTSILRARNDLEGISRDSIILCHERDNKNELAKLKGFYLVTKIFSTNIYTHDGMLEKSQ